MSWFTNSHVDPSTGRNKRDKGPVRGSHGGPKRHNGKPISKAAWRRAQRTGREEQSGGFWGSNSMPDNGKGPWAW